MKIGRSRTLQSARYVQKKRRKMIVTASVATVSVLVVFVIAILILRLPFLKITAINVSGAKTVDIELVKKITQTELDGNYMYLIPKQSIFFYPKRSIREKLINDVSKIEDMRINVINMSLLNIDITERGPSVIICEGYREDSDDSKCSYADQNAITYEKIASSTMNATLFKYYANAPIEIKRFNELQKFVSDIKKAGIVAYAMLIGEEGSFELYIENMDKSSATVYFDDRTSFDKTRSNLLIFWQNVMSKKIGLSEIPNFEYINLRFGNNVFYLVK